MNVNILIGNKAKLHNSTLPNSGESRHHDNQFFGLLKDKVKFNLIELYPHKFPISTKISHLLNHLIQPFSIRKKLQKKSISHIFFGEEASILRLKKPTTPTIVTCLDLIPILYPQGQNKFYQKFITWCLQGLKKADHIVANSNFTARQISNHFKIPSTKITTIYPAVPQIFKPLQTISPTFYKKYNLSTKTQYLLYVGALDIPRKNLRSLLKAFTLVSQSHPHLQLILVGHCYHQIRLQKLLKSVDPQLMPKIHIHQDVSQSDLVNFYNLAKIFIFPSLYEGFGLPPAEAMACGTPVISSDKTSLPEVIGNAGLVCDCTQPNLISTKIHHLLTSPELEKILIKKGLQQITKFSWRNHTDQHLELYQKLQKQYFS